jgi:KDO2-lipid IV(A) lauroyltransferase
MYHFVYGLLYTFSLLPWRVLYLLSDAVYGLLYYVIGYRKAVVMNNLLIAFPQKTELERTRIAKDFYHNFVDTFIETIKMISVSERTLRRRFTANFEVVNELYESGQNVYLVSGHFFNWEFGSLASSILSKYPFVAVYMPISNKIFDRLMLKVRQKFNAIFIPATNFRESFAPHANGRYALILVADQNPGNPERAYWMPFFGKMAPFINGPEKGAKANNAAVVFAHFYREKRGYYKADLKLVTTEPTTYDEGALTDELIRLTEEAIRRKPSNYLWSHRRWKWEYKEDYKHLVRNTKPATE